MGRSSIYGGNQTHLRTLNRLAGYCTLALSGSHFKKSDISDDDRLKATLEDGKGESTTEREVAPNCAAQERATVEIAACVGEGRGQRRGPSE